MDSDRLRPEGIFLVGVSYRTAPVEEREALAISSGELSQALSRLREVRGTAVLLSTCNRTELYGAVPMQTRDEAVALLLQTKDAHLDSSRFYFLRDADAVRHLYRVAAGIDSMVIGESQILGQVREAFSAATAAGTLDGVLSRVFHTALAVGKRARSRTSIARYAVSVSSTAVAVARNVLGDISQSTVLVVSAGGTGKLAARALRESGASRILVANRTYSRAQEMAAAMSGSAIPFSEIVEHLPKVDIVISATGSEHYVLGPNELRQVALRRNGHPLLLIDIAVPRDIDPEVKSIPGIHLFDIDDLQSVSSDPDNSSSAAEIRKVEALIEEEAARFQQWRRSLSAVPVISALRERAETIRRQEVDRALRGLPNLSEEEKGRVEAMTAAIVNKLIHLPVDRVKNSPDMARDVEALEDLFGLSSPSGKR